MTDIITGTEVIALEGQCLDHRERRYMVGLADGETNVEIARAVGVKAEELPFVEASIRGKLGARSKTHMLARAFSLGILQTRALVALVLAVAVIGTTSVVYFKKLAIPTQGDSKALQYDIMAGGSNGPGVQDPHFIDYLTKQHHS